MLERTKLEVNKIVENRFNNLGDWLTKHGDWLTNHEDRFAKIEDRLKTIETDLENRVAKLEELYEPTNKFLSTNGTAVLITNKENN